MGHKTARWTSRNDDNRRKSPTSPGSEPASCPAERGGCARIRCLHLGSVRTGGRCSPISTPTPERAAPRRERPTATAPSEHAPRAPDQEAGARRRLVLHQEHLRQDHRRPDNPGVGQAGLPAPQPSSPRDEPATGGRAGHAAGAGTRAPRSSRLRCPVRSPRFVVSYLVLAPKIIVPSRPTAS